MTVPYKQASKPEVDQHASVGLAPARPNKLPLPQNGCSPPSTVSSSLPPQVCRSFCESVYSVCAEDIAGLNVSVFDPVDLPDCSALPAADDVSGPECWLPITEPKFEELGCTYSVLYRL